jgi:putative spermidine/putrescine transport system ATP-binding protein
MNNSYVEINKLTKHFGPAHAGGNGEGKPVLDQLSLRVKEGELVTLLGPSGCGKSTLLRCIAGLTDFDQGEVRLDGRDLTWVQPKVRQVGMVFQSYALFPNMTVYDNVAFGLVMQRLPRQDIAERTARMLELIDMTDKSAAYPHQLSGGQQQRVALARSLAVQPKLMLMDEPLSALDAKIRRHLRTEIRRIQRELGMTTIFVTHDQEEALTLSDRICVMNEGRIEQVGTPEEVYARPLTTFVARFIGNYNVLSAAQMSAMLAGAELPRAGGAYVPDDAARNVVALATRTARAADKAAARTAEETSAGTSDSTAPWRMPAAAFAIRPEAIRIVDTAGGKLVNADVRVGGDLSLFHHDTNAHSYELEGTAIDSSVLGALHRYTVQVGDLTLTVDALNIPGQRRLEPGSTVRVLIPRDACLPLLS